MLAEQSEKAPEAGRVDGAQARREDGAERGDRDNRGDGLARDPAVMRTISSGDADGIAAMIATRPGAQDRIMALVHQHRGNAIAGAVAACVQKREEDLGEADADKTGPEEVSGSGFVRLPEWARLKKWAPPQKTKASSPAAIEQAWESDVLAWATRNEKLSDKTTKNMLHGLIDASQLILARPPKNVKEMMLKHMLDEIPVPPILGAIKEAMDTAVDYADDKDGRQDEAHRQNFIDDIQNHIRKIDGQRVLQERISRAAGRLMLEVHKAPPEQQSEKVNTLRHQLKDLSPVSEQRFLAAVLQEYWKWGSGGQANFVVPALQGAVAIMPIAPDKISNWEDIVCAIDEGDPDWDTLDYDITIKQDGAAGEPTVIGPNHPKRKEVVKWIEDNKARLEDRFSPEAEKRCQLQRAKRRADRESGGQPMKEGDKGDPFQR